MTKISFLQVCWLAIRPKTLPAAISGVICALAIATLYFGEVSLIKITLCLILAILLQIASNLANDVFDFEKGSDNENRLGPIRVTQSGLAKPIWVKVAMVFTLCLAFVIGSYLSIITNPNLIWFGIAAIVCAVIYTGGPFPLGYMGLGEIMVFIFFGPVCVIGTFYILTNNINICIVAVSIAIGLFTTAILIVNNLRDLENDILSHKKTLATRIGKTATRWEYSLCILIAFLIVPILVIFGQLPMITLISTFAILIAKKPLQMVWHDEGESLNLALALTAKTLLIYSLLLFFSIVFSR